MANDIFRARLVTAVSNAIREAENAGLHDHHGDRGIIRQIVLEKLIKPLLPMSFDLGTGTVVDAAGQKSAQTDIVVYSREILPQILYSGRDGVFPVEASLFAVEVKSRLTAEEVRDAIQKVKRMNQLVYMSGRYDEDGNPLTHVIRRIQPLLFAFSSDLVSGGKSELRRYLELDPGPDPVLPNLCVVGRGFWWQETSGEWRFQKATPDHDEVLIALAMIVNTLPLILKSREQPRFGWYVLPYGSRNDMRADL